MNSNLIIPHQWGHLEEDFHGTNGKTVLFIQDAHDSLEAQQNIAALISYFVKERNVRKVFEEGYEGQLPTDSYFDFMRDITLKEKIAFFLMDRLRLGGAEYAHVTRTKDFELIGADNLEVYFKNLKAYKDTTELQGEILKDLNAIEKSLKGIVEASFPAPIKEWMKWNDLFKKGDLSFFDYLDRIKILMRQKTNLSSVELFSAFPALIKIKELCADPNFSADDKVSNDFLVALQELEVLEEKMITMNLAKAEEREVFYFYQTIQLLKRLSYIDISSNEYESVSATIKEFQTRTIAQHLSKKNNKTIVLSKQWEKKITRALEFYKLVYLRDQAIEKTLDQHFGVGMQKDEKINPGRKIDSSSESSTAILVFGGFHKERIKEILKRKGYSYQIISPLMGDVDLRHQEYYKNLMVGKNHPEENSRYVRKATVQPRLYTQVQQVHFYEYLGSFLEKASSDLYQQLIEQPAPSRSELRSKPEFQMLTNTESRQLAREINHRLKGEQLVRINPVRINNKSWDVETNFGNEATARFLRIGPLFFIDATNSEAELSPSKIGHIQMSLGDLFAKYQGNMLFIEPSDYANFFVQNKTLLSPHVILAIGQMLADYEHYSGRTVWDAGAGRDALLGRIALRMGAKVLFIEKVIKRPLRFLGYDGFEAGLSKGKDYDFIQGDLSSFWFRWSLKRNPFFRDADIGELNIGPWSQYGNIHFNFMEWLSKEKIIPKRMHHSGFRYYPSDESAHQGIEMSKLQGLLEENSYKNRDASYTFHAVDEGVDQAWGFQSIRSESQSKRQDSIEEPESIEKVDLQHRINFARYVDAIKLTEDLEKLRIFENLLLDQGEVNLLEVAVADLKEGQLFAIKAHNLEAQKETILLWRLKTIKDGEYSFVSMNQKVNQQILIAKQEAIVRWQEESRFFQVSAENRAYQEILENQAETSEEHWYDEKLPNIVILKNAGNKRSDEADMAENWAGWSERKSTLDANIIMVEAETENIKVEKGEVFVRNAFVLKRVGDEVVKVKLEQTLQAHYLYGGQIFSLPSNYREAILMSGIPKVYTSSMYRLQSSKRRQLLHARKHGIVFKEPISQIKYKEGGRDVLKLQEYLKALQQELKISKIFVQPDNMANSMNAMAFNITSDDERDNAARALNKLSSLQQGMKILVENFSKAPDWGGRYDRHNADIRTIVTRRKGVASPQIEWVVSPIKIALSKEVEREVDLYTSGPVRKTGESVRAIAIDTVARLPFKIFLDQETQLSPEQKIKLYDKVVNRAKAYADSLEKESIEFDIAAIDFFIVEERDEDGVPEVVFNEVAASVAGEANWDALSSGGLIRKGSWREELYNVALERAHHYWEILRLPSDFEMDEEFEINVGSFDEPQPRHELRMDRRQFLSLGAASAVPGAKAIAGITAEEQGSLLKAVGMIQRPEALLDLSRVHSSGHRTLQSKVLLQAVQEVQHLFARLSDHSSEGLQMYQRSKDELLHEIEKALEVNGEVAERLKAYNGDELFELQTALKGDSEDYEVLQAVKSAIGSVKHFTSTYPSITKEFDYLRRQGLSIETYRKSLFARYYRPAAEQAFKERQQEFAKRGFQQDTLDVEKGRDEYLSRLRRYFEDHKSSDYPSSVGSFSRRLAEERLKKAYEEIVQKILQKLASIYGSDTQLPSTREMFSSGYQYLDATTIQSTVERAGLLASHKKRIYRELEERLLQMGIPEETRVDLLKRGVFASNSEILSKDTSVWVEEVIEREKYWIKQIQSGEVRSDFFNPSVNKEKPLSGLEKLANHLERDSRISPSYLHIHTDNQGRLYRLWWVNSSSQPIELESIEFRTLELYWEKIKKKEGTHYRIFIPRGSKSQVIHSFLDQSALWQQFSSPQSNRVELNVPEIKNLTYQDPASTQRSEMRSVASVWTGIEMALHTEMTALENEALRKRVQTLAGEKEVLNLNPFELDKVNYRGEKIFKIDMHEVGWFGASSLDFVSKYLEDIILKRNNQLGANLELPRIHEQKSTLEFLIFELLKNAFIHGNVANPNDPIYFTWKKENGKLILTVYDSALKMREPILNVSQRLAITLRRLWYWKKLWGFNMFLQIVKETEGLKYSRDSVYSERYVHGIGTAAKIEISYDEEIRSELREAVSLSQNTENDKFAVVERKSEDTLEPLPVVAVDSTKRIRRSKSLFSRIENIDKDVIFGIQQSVIEKLSHEEWQSLMALKVMNAKKLHIYVVQDVGVSTPRLTELLQQESVYVEEQVNRLPSTANFIFFGDRAEKDHVSKHLSAELIKRIGDSYFAIGDGMSAVGLLFALSDAKLSGLVKEKNYYFDSENIYAGRLLERLFKSYEIITQSA